MELRGFDSYNVSLGDELRGERACRGWTIRDASRELCIKPALIEAIENADIAAFPNRSVVPGYVRSYARYLDLDADEIYRRFCEESGFESSLASYGMTQAGAGTSRAATAGALSGAVGADFTASRFAVKPAPRRVGAVVSLGGIVSVAALAALVAGLGYGGYLVLQDIQRVGVAPLPEAPAVVADAPVIPEPGIDYAVAGAERPKADAYAADGVMFAFAPPEALATPAPARRDGPIAAIDPDTTGLIASSYEAAPVRSATGHPAVDDTSGPDAITSGALHGTPADRIASAPVGDPLEGPILPASLGSSDVAEGSATGQGTTDPALAAADAADGAPVAVVASDRAWVRVRGTGRDVLFEGIMEAGDRFELPTDTAGATLRAGNAGGIYIALGSTRFGPLGRSGEVVKRVALDAEAVRDAYPEASRAAAAEREETSDIAGLSD
ncbi:MAG: helix-turn-helix domain-containing protein [Pseudomonadota bacterium]